MRRSARSLVLIAALAPAAAARENAPNAGSAIIPMFSLQHSAMRPGEEITWVASVANGNAHSHASLRPGQAFVFSFTDGTPQSCGSLTTSPTGTLDSSDFTCSVTPTEIRLTYDGLQRAWPYGASVNASVRATAPMAPCTVLLDVETEHEGSYTMPFPHLLQLAIDPDIGSVGPMGPEGAVGATGPQGIVGPQGVVGPRGQTAAGFRKEWLSTDAASGPVGRDTVVPGLDQTVLVQGGSSLLVLVDSQPHVECPRRGDLAPEQWLVIEVDGVEVQRREINNSFQEEGLNLAALVSDLAEGVHQVRVLLQAESLTRSHVTMCVGHATNLAHQARLVAIELPLPD